MLTAIGTVLAPVLGLALAVLLALTYLRLYLSVRAMDRRLAEFESFTQLTVKWSVTTDERLDTLEGKKTKKAKK